MEIKQFYDEALAHASYAIESNKKIALVDPGRDTQPYLDFANEHGGEITMILETHPHADFVSSHMEWINDHGVEVFINPEVGVSYAYTPLSHGDEVKLGDATIRALFTPGHSPDHNSYLLLDENGKESAVFTGDSLFVGDVGRPDLREGAGNVKKSRSDLAAMMFDTLNNVFAKLADDVEVYPAHGPGSLCGKNMSPERWSTIGKEKKDNWAFQFDDKDKFISSFLEGQPFIPQYFPYDVEVNRKGTTSLEDAVASVQVLDDSYGIPEGAVIVDARDEASFKKGHLKGAFNIQLGEESSKFETWLGSIVGPDEAYYLVTADKDQMETALRRVAKIGYETNLKGATYTLTGDLTKDPSIDLANFTENPSDYTIVDIRNESESKGDQIFEGALNIPLAELRNRVGEIPVDKPIVVHCAGGYRSAAGSSIIEAVTPGKVLDLSEAVKDFKEVEN